MKYKAKNVQQLQTQLLVEYLLNAEELATDLANANLPTYDTTGALEIREKLQALISKAREMKAKF